MSRLRLAWDLVVLLTLSALADVDQVLGGYIGDAINRWLNDRTNVRF